MVIMQNKSGQLANRLAAFAHFIANAVEHNYTLINPTFGEYAKYFPATRQNNFGDLPISVRLKPNLPYPIFKVASRAAALLIPRSPLHEFIQWDDHAEFNLNTADFVDKARKKIVITNGWLFRDHVNFAKHAKVIRSIFTPDASIQDAVKRLDMQARQQAEVIVGVHIRRGDYQQWHDGKYFYSNEQYGAMMAQAESCFKASGKRVAFLVCSDEAVDAHAFAPHHVIAGAGRIIEDLYSLATCDYIIGPPSTYSGWAAYYGEVPLMHVTELAQVKLLDDFFHNAKIA
jgi:hypothetical protein